MNEASKCAYGVSVLPAEPPDAPVQDRPWQAPEKRGKSMHLHLGVPFQAPFAHDATWKGLDTFAKVFRSLSQQPTCVSCDPAPVQNGVNNIVRSVDAKVWDKTVCAQVPNSDFFRAAVRIAVEDVAGCVEGLGARGYTRRKYVS